MSFQDFIDNFPKRIIQADVCNESHLDFIHEILIDDLEQIKKNLKQSYSKKYLFLKAIEKNNFELFKELLPQIDFEYKDFQLVIKSNHENIFNYLTQNYYQTMDNSFALNNIKLLLFSIEHQNYPIQKYILDNYTNKKEVLKMGIDILEGTNFNTMKYFLTSPLFKDYFNINETDIFTRICYNIGTEDVFNNEGIHCRLLKLILSEEITNPVNQEMIYQGCKEHLYALSDYPEFLKESHLLRFFMYEKKLSPDNIMTEISYYPQLSEEFSLYTQKRDLYYQMQDLKDEKKPVKNKI